MTPETPTNGFELLRAELREFRAELKGELEATAASFREQLAATGRGIRQDLAAAESRLRGEIVASQAETRRHMAVIAEELVGKIELVGEGVRGVDERLERFRGEVHGEFAKVDRRFLRLEARILGRS